MTSACRVLVLNERGPLHPQAGGAEVHVAEISRRLAPLGFEITQLACGFPGGAFVKLLNSSPYIIGAVLWFISKKKCINLPQKLGRITS